MDERIVIDPRVCHGKPIIRGTRMPVAFVVGSLAGGMSFEDIEREYGLTREDILAALRFAGELVEQEQFHPLPTREQDAQEYSFLACLKTRPPTQSSQH